MKKITIFTCFAIAMILACSVFTSAEANPVRLVDDADLLTSEEENTLLMWLDSLSESSSLDFVILTVNSLGEKSATEYADDYYDYGGYSEDGALLLVSMEERDWAFSTKGYGMTVFTDWGIDYIMDCILGDLSEGFYYDAFFTFLDMSENYVKAAENGEPYDVNNAPKGDFPVFKYAIVALIVAFIAAFVVTGIMKSQLKSVRFANDAASYIRADSFELTESRDLFLYSTITKTPRAQNNSSGGGSKGHFSSSGSRHGGRSGKF